MKFLAGPIDIEDEAEDENVLCVRIISLTHSFCSIYAFFFFALLFLVGHLWLCYLVLCRCALHADWKKNRKKVLKSRICHFSSTSLHFICVRRPRRRVHRFKWRVCEFFLFFFGTQTLQSGGFSPTGARTNTHSTHTLATNRIMSREARNIFLFIFPSNFAHFDRLFNIALFDSIYIFFAVVVLLSSSLTFVALLSIWYCVYVCSCVCASIGQQYESISCNKAICSRSSDLSSSIMSK